MEFIDGFGEGCDPADGDGEAPAPGEGVGDCDGLGLGELVAGGGLGGCTGLGEGFGLSRAGDGDSARHSESVSLLQQATQSVQAKSTQPCNALTHSA